MASILFLFAVLIAYIPLAAWLCSLVMKPVVMNFECGYSIPDSAKRLSMICMPFNSSAQAFQWVFGSVSPSKVTLECRTRGVKRSFSQFQGRFVVDGDKVALKGKFGMAPAAKISLIFWFTLLVSGLVTVSRMLVTDYTNAMLGLLMFIVAMLGFVIWVTKQRVSDYPDEVKFVSANIKNTLGHV